MSTVTRLAILGAAGRMGQALVRCLARDPSLQLVGAVERPGHPSVGSDVGIVARLSAFGVTITDDPNVARQAEVLLDFTSHDAVPGNCRWALENRQAMVIGTTGLNAEEKEAVHRAAVHIPLVWAPNMSLGVNLLFAVARQAAVILGNGYRVEIEETHHVHKKDAPSGTALRLGERVAEGWGRPFLDLYVHDPEGCGKIRADDKIVIRSYRRDEVVGDHTIRFENEGETLEWTHHAWNRDAFALGALRAARWVATRPPGLYDMQDVLGLG